MKHFLNKKYRDFDLLRMSYLEVLLKEMEASGIYQNSIPLVEDIIIGPKGQSN